MPRQCPAVVALFGEALPFSCSSDGDSSSVSKRLKPGLECRPAADEGVVATVTFD